MKKYWQSKLINTLVFGLLFALIVNFTPALFCTLWYNAHSFDYFVDIENVELVGIDGYILDFDLKRSARFDISASAKKEVYRMTGQTIDGEEIWKQIDGVHTTPDFIYETELNGLESGFEIRWDYELPKGETYRVVDLVILDMPYGKDKKKVITTNEISI